MYKNRENNALTRNFWTQVYLCSVQHRQYSLGICHHFMEDKKICWYDSFGTTDHVSLKVLLQFLKDEHMPKYKREFYLNNDWKLMHCLPHYPIQDNSTILFVYPLSHPKLISNIHIYRHIHLYVLTLHSKVMIMNSTHACL